ncbi:Uncharacterised protein [uncultured archaeon]|nr:Uncharacterised protein [uncultured archaeon]
MPEDQQQGNDHQQGREEHDLALALAHLVCDGFHESRCSCDGHAISWRKVGQNDGFFCLTEYLRSLIVRDIDRVHDGHHGMPAVGKQRLWAGIGQDLVYSLLRGDLSNTVLFCLGIGYDTCYAAN